MKIDDWFKPLLLFLLIIFLIILYSYSQNGRYAFVHSGDNLCWGDSRTGTLYGMSNGEVVKIEFPLGKMTTSPIQQINRSPKQ
jgi:hypothetical protein